MSRFTKEMYAEGQRRMDYLVGMYGLNPNLSKYLEEGKVYYSYMTGGGMIGSVDTITYDPRYEKIVQDFETQIGGYVYHCVETGSMLSLLFVGSDPSEWAGSFGKETTARGTLIRARAYVYNLDDEFGEIGDVCLAGGRDVLGNVVLIRVG